MKFNLITDPWIPVRKTTGETALLSLAAVFANPEQISDLDARPHERISLMRLLICIAQAAGGIPEEDEWDDFRADFAGKSVGYLSCPDVTPYFELFGKGQRFLQLPVTSKEPVSCSKLFPMLASGNNPTVLDHEGGTEREFPPAQLALGLLVFQNFYPLYGAGYKGRGPAVDSNMLHTFVGGRDLQHIIANNCLDTNEVSQFSGGVGRPIWEKSPSSVRDADAIANASSTYLGRLVPMHRSVRLTDDGRCFNLVKDSIEYPPFDVYSREPSSTVVVWGKKGAEKPRLLPARLDQAVWRQLHSLTVLRREEQSTASAPAVLDCYRQNAAEADCPIWTGALVTDLKAKILDVIESTFSLPEAMFGSGRKVYAQGVQHAEFWEGRLKKAVSAYGSNLMKDKPSTREATQHFWNALDQQSEVLLNVVRDPEATFDMGSKNAWIVLINQAVRAAFEFACPRQTPRHYEAYAAGLGKLYPKPSKKKRAAAKALH